MSNVIDSTAIVRATDVPVPVGLFGAAGPAGIVRAATEVADQLAQVVERQKLFTNISGRKHVRVEGWTLLGNLLGVFPVVVWTRPLEHEGKVFGWEAGAEARTMSGAVVGAAEAMCTKGEKTWSSRDSFALRSMAQCVPLDSEILTRNGFRRHDELVVGEDVLAYVPEEDCTRWTPLLAVNVFPEEPLRRMRSRSFDVRCTYDHSWAVQRIRGAEREPYQALVPANLLKQRDNIITTAAEPLGGDSPLTPAEAAILGWLITDGYLNRRGIGIHVRGVIDQSKEPYVSEIRELVGVGARESVTYPNPNNLTPAGRPWGVKPVTRFTMNAASTRDLLEKAGITGREDVPALVCRLSPEARRAMLDAMLKADGTRRRGGDLWAWGKKNPAAVEAFQVLCALEGVPLGRQHAREDLTFYSMRRHRAVQVLRLKWEDGGTEPVWCPTTVHGTWVMRQKGQVTITGNTRAISKALRLPLGFVMTLAGYDPCPEEEMPGDMQREAPRAQAAPSQGQGAEKKAEENARTRGLKAVNALIGELFAKREEFYVWLAEQGFEAPHVEAKGRRSIAGCSAQELRQVYAALADLKKERAAAEEPTL